MYLESQWKDQNTSSLAGPEEIWGEDCMRVMRWNYMHGEEKLFVSVRIENKNHVPANPK
jgi:hypothetical protein